jgi:3-hydroxyacyl-CoA dehydrogenase
MRGKEAPGVNVPLLDYRVQDRIAVISVAATAAPAAALLRELSETVQRAQAEGVEGIVLAGICGIAPEGATEAAALERTCQDLEQSRAPVIAAVEGALSAGALELALACRWRIGTPEASLGFPEVKLGLLPAPGSIERLVRSAGALGAIELVSAGSRLPAEQALRVGLLDGLGRPAQAAAVEFARAAAERAPAAASAAVTLPDAEQFAQLRLRAATRARGQLAPLRIIDAVEALCTRAPAEARALVRACYEECRHGEQHQALLHAAAAQRAAATIPDLPPGTAALPLRSAAVIGAGTMGGGIAMSLANAGIPVTLLEVSSAALERGLGLIAGNYEASVRRGSLDAGRAATARALIRGTTDYAALSGADILIEAVFEELAVKRAVFARLDAVAAPQAILATNTSTLDIDAIAAATSRPQQVVGTHFFSPAHIMRLLENVRGRATSAQVLRTVMELGTRLGKATVLSGNADGFIGNRMLMFYGLEAEFLLEEGATPQQIDRVMEEFGFAMGPLAVRDLAGNDVGLAIRRSRTLPADERWSPILERMVAAGRLGQKAGKGFYRYEGRTRVTDPEALAIIAAVARELGIAPRPIPDAEIRDRLLHPLVNAGAQLVADGIALRTGDVDTVYINGYGFPLWRGGPMYWAERDGLERVVATARKLAALHGARWGPAPLLLEAARVGHWP